MRCLYSFNAWSFLFEYSHQLLYHHPYIHDYFPKSNIFCEMIVYGSFMQSFFFPENCCIFVDLGRDKHMLVILWLVIQ